MATDGGEGEKSHPLGKVHNPDKVRLFIHYLTAMSDRGFSSTIQLVADWSFRPAKIKYLTYNNVIIMMIIRFRVYKLPNRRG